MDLDMKERALQLAFRFLTFEDLLVARSCSSLWKSVASSAGLWRSLLQHHFPSTAQQLAEGDPYTIGCARFRVAKALLRPPTQLTEIGTGFSFCAGERVILAKTGDGDRPRVLCAPLPGEGKEGVRAVELPNPILPDVTEDTATEDDIASLSALAVREIGPDVVIVASVSNTIGNVLSFQRLDAKLRPYGPPSILAAHTTYSSLDLVPVPSAGESKDDPTLLVVGGEWNAADIYRVGISAAAEAAEEAPVTRLPGSASRGLSRLSAVHWNATCGERVTGLGNDGAVRVWNVSSTALLHHLFADAEQAAHFRSSNDPCFQMAFLPRMPDVIWRAGQVRRGGAGELVRFDVRAPAASAATVLPTLSALLDEPCALACDDWYTVAVWRGGYATVVDARTGACVATHDLHQVLFERFGEPQLPRSSWLPLNEAAFRMPLEVNAAGGISQVTVLAWRPAQSDFTISNLRFAC